MNNALLGQRIKEARIDGEYTVESLAQCIGLNKSTISRYERGEIESPKMPVIESIANELHVNPSWLIGKSDDKSYTPPGVKGPLLYVNNIFAPLRNVRMALKLSPEEVAYEVGISRADYLKIADVLHIPLEYALSPDGTLNEEDMLYVLRNKVSRLQRAFRSLSDIDQDSVIDFAENLLGKSQTSIWITKTSLSPTSWWSAIRIRSSPMVFMAPPTWRQKSFPPAQRRTTRPSKRTYTPAAASGNTGLWTLTANPIEVYRLGGQAYVLYDVYTQHPDWQLAQMTEEERAALVTHFQCGLFDDLDIAIDDIFCRTF